jgi:hypothetical protein
MGFLLVANDLGGGDRGGGARIHEYIPAHGRDHGQRAARIQRTVYFCPLVTGHLSPVTSLISGYELWKIDNGGLIGESKRHFDSAEYERQLKHGVDG